MSLIAFPLASRPTVLPRSEVVQIRTPVSTPADTGMARKAATPAREEANVPSPVSTEELTRQRRQAAKALAHKQVKALMERMRMLKQYASEDPKVMARQLAQIVKELKIALKAYADAGGSPGAAGGAAAGEGRTTAANDGNASPPTDPDGKRLYREMKDEIDGEAIGDMTFVKEVREFGKSIRELLTKAKIQTALKGPDEETREAFKDTEEGLKAVDEALDSLDRGIRASSPEAGMFVALYA